MNEVSGGGKGESVLLKMRHNTGNHWSPFFSGAWSKDDYMGKKPIAYFEYHTLYIEFAFAL